MEADETIIIALNSELNLGSKHTTTLTISEDNIAPELSVQVEQNKEVRQTVSKVDGEVNIIATVSDSNPQDSLTVIWESDDLIDIDNDDLRFSFNPENVTAGLHKVTATVTDNGTPSLSVKHDVYIKVEAQLAVLSSEVDTDGDMIPDSEEGYKDTDGDGIPDYQDAISACNVVPEQADEQTQFLTEGDPGVCLRKGTASAQSNLNGLQLSDDDVTNITGGDTQAKNVGGIFDYIAYGLPVNGQNYKVVFPQLLPIPAGAVYRKYNERTGWTEYVTDADNKLFSAQGDVGYCPPPGDSSWVEGLVEGSWCVQLQIQDGSPNDDDGSANGTIVDPGGVSVYLNGNSLPVAVNDSATIKWHSTNNSNDSNTINVLSNDYDGDTLTLANASADFGDVVVNADNTLSYTPNSNYVGQDRISYSITDGNGGNGGTGYAELIITVNANKVPVVVDETASTEGSKAIDIDVLSNDSDEDIFSVSSVSASSGTVVINNDNTLTYTPERGFDGEVTISYNVSDGEDTTTGTVLVSVSAYETLTVVNRSGSGGTMPWWFGFAALSLMVYRYRFINRLINVNNTKKGTR
ncbi:MAG: cadherin-like domain-containing protein [Colwellia sp.]